MSPKFIRESMKKGALGEENYITLKNKKNIEKRGPSSSRNGSIEDVDSGMVSPKDN